MFEVEVISEGSNVALGKSATQGSTLKHFDAARAIDGDVGTFSHTDPGACSNWEVDLGELKPIHSITIKNRWCKSESDDPQCLCRLSQATVSLFDDQDEWVHTALIGNMCGELEWVYDYSPIAC